MSRAKSERLKAYEAELDAMRPKVRRRSGGKCEAMLLGVCRGQAQHVHHRLRRPHGGPNTMANLIDLCSPCHSWVHAHVRPAQKLGLLLKMGADPETKPVVPWSAATHTVAR